MLLRRQLQQSVKPTVSESQYPFGLSQWHILQRSKQVVVMKSGLQEKVHSLTHKDVVEEALIQRKKKTASLLQIKKGNGALEILCSLQKHTSIMMWYNLIERLQLLKGNVSTEIFICFRIFLFHNTVTLVDVNLWLHKGNSSQDTLYLLRFHNHLTQVDRNIVGTP